MMGIFGLAHAAGSMMTTDTNMGASMNSPLAAATSPTTPGPSAFNIVWRNTATGQDAVWGTSGGINGGMMNATPNMMATVADPNWTIVGTADFNGDGKPDILWRHSPTGQNAVWYMNGATLMSGVSLPAVTDPNWKIMAVSK